MDRPPITSEALVDALRETGICAGDLVFVQSRLFSFGMPIGVTSSDELSKFHYKVFQKALGPQGTLCVLTAFEDYGRYGTPFVLETSPSRVGAFSEFVRRQPGAIRSVHPIMSVTSIGNRADEISGGPHFEGLGYDSPWGRLHRANAKLIVYGGGFKDGMTFFHYIESMYRVPYQYTKLYDTPVYARGSVQPGLFTLTVRYLDFGIANDAGRFERVLVDSEHARVVHIRGTKISVVPAMSAFDLGIEALREDRYFFLKYPPVFRRGHIPFDGATGPMRESYDADPRTKLTPGGALNDRQTFRGIPWSDLF